MNKLGTVLFVALLLAVTFWMGMMFATSNNEQRITREIFIEDINPPALSNTAKSMHFVELSHQGSEDTEIVNEEMQKSDTSSPQDSDVASLQRQVKELSQRVNQQQERISTQTKRYNQAVASLREAGLSVPDSISLEEASKLLPAPFNNVIANASPQMTDLFKKLHAQEEDFGWAISMQQQIQDYFITHEKGHLLQLTSIICKADICEVRGFESQHDIYKQVIDDLAMQEWWAPYSTNTVSGSDGDERGYFYLLVRFAR